MTGSSVDRPLKEAAPGRGPGSRRLKLWNVRGNMQCSIVGTCLSDADLKDLLKRCRLKADPDLPAYDLHGYFTTAITTDNHVARAVTKLLDRRHEGIVRRVGRAEGEELSVLWSAEFASGRIAGAYWAFMTHGHIPPELHTRVFGEVHMLSHVMGRISHASAARASETEARLADAEARLARQTQRHQAALAERDRTIAALRQSLQAVAVRRGGPVASPAIMSEQAIARARRMVLKRERALVSARRRARDAEARVRELEADIAISRLDLPAQAASGAGQDPCPGAEACRLRLPPDETLRVLYLGGRAGAVDQLRQVAQAASAELVHHDGGLEQSTSRIDPLVENCHAVVCPVDCVSHRACLRAKELCRRHNKAFIPLRSSGVSTFRRALAGIGLERG